MKIHPDKTLSNNERALAAALSYSNITDKQRHEIVQRFYSLIDAPAFHDKVNSMMREIAEHSSARQDLRVV